MPPPSCRHKGAVAAGHCCFTAVTNLTGRWSAQKCLWGRAICEYVGFGLVSEHNRPCPFVHLWLPGFPNGACNLLEGMACAGQLCPTWLWVRRPVRSFWLALAVPAMLTLDMVWHSRWRRRCVLAFASTQ
jgi:hypothetical protein